ncbi:MAG: sulfatase-like hydrolase/transferase [Solirubrobacterales bacterium]|nr:sulfatase-like hydrolase/transferase [Solirubrobacterales bacterium]OJU95959.1 MAG: hypothetical protein BGO23_10355 [Solirubrobacterales bacterium 67-14]
MNVKPGSDSTGNKQYSWLRIWAEVAGAWAIGIAHPLYTSIASGPEALSSYGLRRFDVLALIILLSLVGPLVIALFEVLLRKLTNEKVRLVFHGLAVGTLFSIVIWDWMTDHGHSGTLRSLLPVLFAFGFAWCMLRFELIRNFVLVFQFATVVVIISFVVSYPIWSTVGPHEPASAAQSTDSETPVVMVIFDELPLAALEDRQGKIDAEHFPTFAQVAATSTWYPGTRAVGDQTVFAVPSIMTGQDPAGGSAVTPPPPSGAEYPDNLCAILKKAGYEDHAYEPVTDFCERSYSFTTRMSGVLDRATVRADPGFTLNPGYWREMLVRGVTKPFKDPYTEYDSDRPKAVSDFVEGMPGSDRAISLLHIALPHVMWMFQPDGTSYPNWRPPGQEMLISPPTRGENSRDMQQMMLQLAYADTVLKQVIDRMKQLGIWEKSMFVVTADHGGAFLSSGSRRIIDSKNAGWILPVPLLIKQPGQTKSRVVRGPVDSRDITPTVLAELGLKPGEKAVGRDLNSLDRLPARKELSAKGVFGEQTLKRSLVEREFEQAKKFRNQLFPGSLYAIGGDPDHLIGTRPKGLQKLDFELGSADQYEDVDTSSGYVPAWIQGTLTDPGDPPPKHVAIALNGKIVAIAPVWTVFRITTAGAVVPDKDFVDGKNDVAVYRVPDGQHPDH